MILCKLNNVLSFQIVDILNEYDKSNEPVTHFPSKLAVPPSPPPPARAPPRDPEPGEELDLDTWNDSHISSDEEGEPNKGLVKSKVSR